MKEKGYPYSAVSNTNALGYLMTVKLEYKEQLILIIHKYLPMATIYLFGSRARGDHSSTSDIDLAVDAGAPIAFSLLLKILSEIDGSTIPMKVDVVDMNSASEAIKESIKREGIIWTK